MRKVREILEDFETRLKRARVYFPEKDSMEILAHALDIKKEEIHRFFDVELDQRSLERAEEIMRRREKREPLARIFGSVLFGGISICTAPNVFKPCSGPEAMVEHILSIFEGQQNQTLRILDLGTGTGCLLLALLHRLPKATGVGIDVSEQAVSLAKKNAQSNSLSNRAEFLVADWNGEIEGQFDLIISHPPAVETKKIPFLSPEMKNYDPVISLDGGTDGLSFFRSMVQNFERLAKQKALGVFTAYSTKQEASIFDKAGFPVDVILDVYYKPLCIVVTNDRQQRTWLPLFFRGGGILDLGSTHQKEPHYAHRKMLPWSRQGMP